MAFVFENPPLAEYLENSKRARGAISDGIINLNQPSHNTSSSVTVDNEFSDDANKPLLFSATSEFVLFLFVAKIYANHGKSILQPWVLEVSKKYFFIWTSVRK